jgi:virginiamycin A acetyltransferase
MIEISPDARIGISTKGSKLHVGENTHIFEFVVIKFVGGKGNITIGKECYINPHTVIYSGRGVYIGDSVLIGPGCVLAGSNHTYKNPDVTIKSQGFDLGRGIVIDSDVWIGANCTILDGAWIREGSVIAAGSVVNCEVPKFQVWGGVPAKFLKER